MRRAHDRVVRALRSVKVDQASTQQKKAKAHIPASRAVPPNGQPLARPAFQSSRQQNKSNGQLFSLRRETGPVQEE